MSIRKFPNYLYEIVNTGGSVDIGSFTIDGYKQISNVTLPMIFYRTDLFINQQVRVSIERPSQSDTIVSSWFNPLNSIDTFLESDHWLGWVRLDLARQNILDTEVLSLSIETQNYTHLIGGTQIGVIENYLDSSGIFEVLGNKAAYAKIFGYQ